MNPSIQVKEWVLLRRRTGAFYAGSETGIESAVDVEWTESLDEAIHHTNLHDALMSIGILRSLEILNVFPVPAILVVEVGVTEDLALLDDYCEVTGTRYNLKIH